METYSLERILRLTPLRTSLAASPVPRMRCTFWASRSAVTGRGAEDRPKPGGLNGEGAGWSSSVRATDHLHGVILGGSAGGVDGGEHGDQDGGDEGLDVHVDVLGHEEPFGFDEAFDLDGEAAEAFDNEFARDDADGCADQADDHSLEEIDE